LESHFSNKPLVVFYEEMIANPFAFIDRIAKYIGAEYDQKDINLDKRHSSYNQNQIKAIDWLGNYFNLRKRRIFKNPILHFIWKIYLGSIRYSVLFISKLLPNSFFDQSPLIEKSELEHVKMFFTQDWEKCLDYAKRIGEEADFNSSST
jgi:hypothetical protein